VIHSSTGFLGVRPRAGVRAVDRWFFRAAPASRLAVFRILTGVYAVSYLLVRFREFFRMADGSAAAWDPVGVLWWLDRPLPTRLVQLVVLIAVVLGVLYTVGVAFRAVGPLFALTLLFVTTYRCSWGQLLWFDNLLVLHVIIVGCSPAAEAYTPRRRLPAARADVRFGWPVRLAAVITVLTYALAAIAKLRVGGTAWIGGESLRNHIAYSAARLKVLGATPSPLARPLMGQLWVFTPLAVATLVIELGAPLVLFVDRLRWAWVAAAAAMHAAIAATMFVVFAYPLTLVAFAPLFDLEQLPLRCAPLARRVTSAPHDTDRSSRSQ
jgi:hypothetical protein